MGIYKIYFREEHYSISNIIHNNMDFKSVLNNPFGNYFELMEWFKEFPLDDESTEFIFLLLKKIENDMSQGKFIQAILESKTVEENPKLFIEKLSKYSDDKNIKWLMGLVISKFNIHTVKNLDDDTTKLGFIISSMYRGEFSEELKDELKKLLETKDENIISTLISHINLLTDKEELLQLLLEIGDKYNTLLLNNCISSDIKIDRLYPIVEKAITQDIGAADSAWYLIYFKNFSPQQVSDLCILTLRNYFPYELRFFDWCIKDKAKKLPEFIEHLVGKLGEFDIFRQRCVWGILTEGNTNKTIEMSKILVDGDDNSEKYCREKGYYFHEIKRKLYRYGSKDNCITLFKILKTWLKDKDYLSIPEITDEQLDQYKKNRTLQILHEITDQLIGFKTNFDKKTITNTLKNYPKLCELAHERIIELLDKKMYHPILVDLSYTIDSEHRAYPWCNEILKKIDYYFTNFPKVKNEKYPKTDDLIKHMVADFFNEPKEFLSQVYIFEKLHSSNVLVTCEPDINGSHPEYLIEIDKNKIIAEVKNFELSEDIKISGSGSNIGKKFSRNIKEAYFQTVPIEDPKYPAILIFDTSRSLIDEELIHDSLHGSLSYLVSIEDPKQEAVAYRKRDFLKFKYELATYIQAVILFRPALKEKKIFLSGSIVEHRYRDELIDTSVFKKLSSILFND